jgi:hypothetical protein
MAKWGRDGGRRCFENNRLDATGREREKGRGGGSSSAWWQEKKGEGPDVAVDNIGRSCGPG